VDRYTEGVIDSVLQVADILGLLRRLGIDVAGRAASSTVFLRHERYNRIINQTGSHVDDWSAKEQSIDVINSEQRPYKTADISNVWYPIALTPVTTATHANDALTRSSPTCSRLLSGPAEAFQSARSSRARSLDCRRDEAERSAGLVGTALGGASRLAAWVSVVGK